MRRAFSKMRKLARSLLNQVQLPRSPAVVVQNGDICFCLNQVLGRLFQAASRKRLLVSYHAYVDSKRPLQALYCW